MRGFPGEITEFNNKGRLLYRYVKNDTESAYSYNGDKYRSSYKNPGKTYMKYNSDGNLIYCRTGNKNYRTEQWYHYEGKILRSSRVIDKTGEVNRVFNNKGNQIFFSDSYTGISTSSVYENNKEIYNVNNGNETFKKYDDKGNIIYERFSSGWEIWKEYNSKNEMIWYATSKYDEYWIEYEKIRTLIYYDVINDYEYYMEKYIQRAYSRDSNGFEKLLVYNNRNEFITDIETAIYGTKCWYK